MTITAQGNICDVTTVDASYTLEVMSECGARPIFIDSNNDVFRNDPVSLEYLITFPAEELIWGVEVI